MIHVLPVERGDRPWVVRRLEEAFGDVTVARKGVLIDASILPGFVAADGGRPVGLITYYAAHGECEVVAIISTEEGRSIGQALMDAGYRRLWLVTTNDNIRAFRFYQLWGMDLCAFHRHGVRRSREVKSSLPERGPTASRCTTNSSSRCSRTEKRVCADVRRVPRSIPASSLPDPRPCPCNRRPVTNA